MPESKNNAWLHGPALFEPLRFPSGMESVEGLVPMAWTINLEVGEEIVLCLKDTTPFISTLAKTRPFNLRIHGGVGRNRFGCLGFFVFWVPSPFNERVPLAIYDLYVNLRDEKLLGMWRELAFQTHWHMLLLDRKNEKRGFFEFRNTFRIQNFLEEMEDYCRGIPVVDFDRAKAEFMAERSVEDLFRARETSPTSSESGLSVYDSQFAIPQASDSSNPLRAARFVTIFRESVERHSGDGKLPAATYLDNKLRALKSEVAARRIIYLDVCHWINLRHVWLQSRLALPVYEQIVDRLNRLAERKAVLCPLSVPIFEELMKQQLDARSRVATADLMDIFSQGICLMRFEEAFVEQCRSALAGKGLDVRIKSSSVSKVGLWFGDDQARAAWWSPGIQETWDNISIDLRWELTVCDAQKLTVQGFVPRAAKRDFFSKWVDLSAQQKASPKPFWELSKRCRNDVVEDYAAEVLARMETLLGDTQRDEVRDSVLNIARTMIESQDYGRIPCCEVLAGMCAARVFGGGKVRPNDIFDFLHASAGIPSSEAYFCDGPMAHLARSKHLKLDEHFGVKVHNKPEELLRYLKETSESA
jgi:hypothetical protein